MPATLRELADEFSCRLYGDPGRTVARVGTLSGAGPDAVSFLANPLYRAQLAGYAAAFPGEAVMLGLYFPLMNGWRETAP